MATKFFARRSFYLARRHYGIVRHNTNNHSNGHQNGHKAMLQLKIDGMMSRIEAKM